MDTSSAQFKLLEHGIQPTVRNSRQFVWNRGETHLGHAEWYPGCRSLFLWEALNRKLGTWNPTRRFSLTDRNMCRKHVQAGYNSACRHLARRSNGDSFGRQGPGPASCSIATPPTHGASQPLFGASSWWKWAGCGTPSPSFCSDRMGHGEPCAAQHRNESVESVSWLFWRGSVSRRVEAKQYLLLATLNTGFASWSGHAGLICLVCIHTFAGESQP